MCTVLVGRWGRQLSSGRAKFVSLNCCFYDHLVFPVSMQMINDLNAKGQLISECHFDVLNFPKTKNLKSGQIIRQIMTLIQIVSKLYYQVLSFCWFHHFLYSRAEICQIFHWFLENKKISKRHSEINWSLVF